MTTTPREVRENLSWFGLIRLYRATTELNNSEEEFFASAKLAFLHSLSPSATVWTCSIISPCRTDGSLGRRTKTKNCSPRCGLRRNKLCEIRTLPKCAQNFLHELSNDQNRDFGPFSGARASHVYAPKNSCSNSHRVLRLGLCYVVRFIS